MSRKLTPQTPGEPQATDQGETQFDPAAEAAARAEIDPADFQSDEDAAIAAGQAGRARKIEKPRAPVAPAVMAVADSTRSGAANINAKQQMTAAAAADLDRQGKLQRPALTEQGWYCPLNSAKERAARKKQGDAEFVEIE